MAAAPCVVVEDSPAGVAAAHAAGMRAIAVLTTHGPGALAAAELIVRDVGSLRVDKQDTGLAITMHSPSPPLVDL